MIYELDNLSKSLKIAGNRKASNEVDKLIVKVANANLPDSGAADPKRTEAAEMVLAGDRLEELREETKEKLRNISPELNIDLSPQDLVKLIEEAQGVRDELKRINNLRKVSKRGALDRFISELREKKSKWGDIVDITIKGQTEEQKEKLIKLKELFESLNIEDLGFDLEMAKRAHDINDPLWGMLDPEYLCGLVRAWFPKPVADLCDSYGGVNTNKGGGANKGGGGEVKGDEKNRWLEDLAAGVASSIKGGLGPGPARRGGGETAPEECSIPDDAIPVPGNDGYKYKANPDGVTGYVWDVDTCRKIGPMPLGSISTNIPGAELPVEPGKDIEEAEVVTGPDKTVMPIVQVGSRLDRLRGLRKKLSDATEDEVLRYTENHPLALEAKNLLGKDNLTVWKGVKKEKLMKLIDKAIRKEEIGSAHDGFTSTSNLDSKIIKDLISISNTLDNSGLIKEANYLDNIITKIAQDLIRPDSWSAQRGLLGNSDQKNVVGPKLDEKSTDLSGLSNKSVQLYEKNKAAPHGSIRPVGDPFSYNWNDEKQAFIVAKAPDSLYKYFGVIIREGSPEWDILKKYKPANDEPDDVEAERSEAFGKADMSGNADTTKTNYFSDLEEINLEKTLKLAIKNMNEGYGETARELITIGIESFKEDPLYHDLIPELRYYLAESWLMDKKYDKAMVAFQTVVDTFGDTEWAAHAMLKQGDCFAAMKQDENAEFFYDEVARLYPKSEAATYAKRSKKYLSEKRK